MLEVAVEADREAAVVPEDVRRLGMGDWTEVALGVAQDAVLESLQKPAA
ncbi:hypothetical protein LUW76_30975 [Actinomadura madurae]|nr:hypothetical protein [Actinomadura madurae]URM98415.1 hypothetical protein LUW76_30975 [Actinomadura madurae]